MFNQHIDFQMVLSGGMKHNEREYGVGFHPAQDEFDGAFEEARAMLQSYELAPIWISDFQDFVRPLGSLVDIVLARCRHQDFLSREIEQTFAAMIENLVASWQFSIVFINLDADVIELSGKRLLQLKPDEGEHGMEYACAVARGRTRVLHLATLGFLRQVWIRCGSDDDSGRRPQRNGGTAAYKPSLKN